MFEKLFNSLSRDSKDEKKEVNVPVTQAQKYESVESDNDDDDDDETETYDLDTLHGLHYTEAQFEKEVERLVEECAEEEREEGSTVTEADLSNFRVNIGDHLFREWNPNGSARYDQFSKRWAAKPFGQVAYGQVKDDGANPLLEPIHGVSLYDYAAMSSKMASGVSMPTLLAVLGIEEPIWAEVNQLWAARMREDSTFSVVNLFSQYFGEAAQHPKLGTLDVSRSSDAKSNIERINVDEYFYYELSGARNAAYEYGIDGAQWVLSNYGIPLGEFQSAATKWMLKNQESTSEQVAKMLQYQEEKSEEYAAKFAKEQGGNVADDINF